MTDPIIRRDDDGRLDEFNAENVSVHFEALGEAQFWVLVTTKDGRQYHLDFGAKNHRARGYAVVGVSDG